jgi:hypothetical protein
MHSNAFYAVGAFAAVAAFASTAANADDITIDNTPFQSTRTRAEVLAELGQFKKSGVNPWSNRYNQLAGFNSSKTRAQVQAEYVAARNEVAAMSGEDSGSAYLAQLPGGYNGSTTLAGTPANAQ